MADLGSVDFTRPGNPKNDFKRYKGNAFSDFMSVLAARPLYIHSAKQDTDSFLIETTDHEIWVVWRGTQVMFYFEESYHMIHIK